MFQRVLLLQLSINRFATYSCYRDHQCSNIHQKLVQKPMLEFSIQKMYYSKAQKDYGYTPDKKPCVNISNILIQSAKPCDGKSICSFLNTHYWPREPSFRAVWLDIDSEYIRHLNDQYAFHPTMDRFIAFEYQPRIDEYEMVGLLIASKKYPWHAEELEKWGLSTISNAASTHILFRAHCFNSPNLFQKYKVPFIYDIDVLVTCSHIERHGLAQLLLRRAVARAMDLKYPLVQMICTNTYMQNSCRRINMSLDWSMDYRDLTDYRGRHLLFPQYPHNTVTIYSRKLQGIPNKCDDPLLYEAYMQMISPCKPIKVAVPGGKCFTRDNMRYGADKKPSRSPGTFFTGYKNIYSDRKECPFKCYPKLM